MDKLFHTLGPVPVNSPFRVERPSIENQLEEHIDHGDYVALIGPYNSGKTSLLFKIKSKYQHSPHTMVVYLDTTPLRDVEASKWYRHVTTSILDQTNSRNLVTPIEEYDAFSFREMFVELLSKTASKILILIDEVGATPIPIRTGFFGTVREMHVSRHIQPEFARLVFVLAGTFRMDDLIPDPTISPFRVAEKVYMTTENIESTFQLVKVFETTNYRIFEDAVARIQWWTNGNLYLIQQLCSHIMKQESPPQEITSAIIDDIVDHFIHSDDLNLSHIIKQLDADPDLKNLALSMVNIPQSSRFSYNNSMQLQLYLLGILTADANGTASISNNIYLNFLRIHLKKQESSFTSTLSAKKVFISYRRADAGGWATSIYQGIVPYFAKNAIFRDVESIKYGSDFEVEINEAVWGCDALIAVIGKKWLSIKAKDGNGAQKPRIHIDDDYVRLEIAAALKRQIRVIPVLVDDATMPKEDRLPENLKLLVKCNAIYVRNDSFVDDIQRLVRALID
ncbi:MAG: AAA-like domain-containing protein [Anaerolineae bacterium]|nr:AAA-like domain-containing protein [Anaerolineae bacterium]